LKRFQEPSYAEDTKQLPFSQFNFSIFLNFLSRRCVAAKFLVISSEILSPMESVIVVVSCGMMMV
jgi:hypothetical protein